MLKNHRITQIEDYEQFVGAEAIERIMKKAKSLQYLHVANVSSTYYGGGVAQLLTSLTLLMNSVGIRTGWRVIQGARDFFSITKKMHNALQGETIKRGEEGWKDLLAKRGSLDQCLGRSESDKFLLGFCLRFITKFRI